MLLPLFFFLKFQFHKGTIKTPFSLYSDPFRTKFQFHKGTIKTEKH